MAKKQIEKKIVAFCCENSALKAAEALSDPATLEAVELVRLPCTGKAETGLLLACLERGHPGVLVLGCPQDNCKFLVGSTRAAKRVQATRRILKEAGLAEERVCMDFVSSPDAHRLARIVREMRERLAALESAPAAGPAPAAAASPSAKATIGGKE
jgi:F420-non-reducing hydrogenase iron-sulfur subunit